MERATESPSASPAPEQSITIGDTTAPTQMVSASSSSTALTNSNASTPSDATSSSRDGSTPLTTFHPFLRLPAEMRNHIYSYAMGGHDITLEPYSYHFDEDTEEYVSSWRGRFHPARDDLPFKRKVSVVIPHVAHPLALIQVNREIRAETLLLPYALNRFHFWSLCEGVPFMETLTEQQSRAIRDVRFVIQWSLDSLIWQFDEEGHKLEVEVPAGETFKTHELKKWMRDILGYLKGVESMVVEELMAKPGKRPVIMYKKKEGVFQIDGKDTVL